MSTTKCHPNSPGQRCQEEYSGHMFIPKTATKKWGNGAESRSKSTSLAILKSGQGAGPVAKKYTLSFARSFSVQAQGLGDLCATSQCPRATQVLAPASCSCQPVVMAQEKGTLSPRWETWAARWAHGQGYGGTSSEWTSTHFFISPIKKKKKLSLPTL